MRVYRDSYRDRESGKLRKARKWTIELSCLGRTRKVTAYTDKAASDSLGRRCVRLAALKESGEVLDPELSRWVEGIPERLRARLAKIGLLEPRQLAACRPVESLLDDFAVALRMRDRAPERPEKRERHVRQQMEAFPRNPS